MFNSGNRGREGAGSPFPAPPQQAQHGSTTKRGTFSVIGPDVTISGNVSATADLHIEGRIEGDVRCAAFVQGSESCIRGTVSAESARLGGTIEGAVSIRQLTIEHGAKIIGDVEYESIAIENGAHIDGRLRHLSAVSAAVAPVLDAHYGPVTIINLDDAAA